MTTATLKTVKSDVNVIERRESLPYWLYMASKRNAEYLIMDLEELGLECATYRDVRGHIIVQGSGDVKAACESSRRHMATTIMLWFPDLTNIVGIRFDATTIAQKRDGAWQHYKEWVRDAHALLLSRGQDVDHIEEFDPDNLSNEELESIEDVLGPIPLCPYPLSAAITPATCWAVEQ